MAVGADILIVGGGCMGASIAYQLARARAGDVLVVERATLASGTTGRSSSIVRQHYSLPTLAHMAQRSLRTFQHFDEQVGGEVGFRQTGLLIGARAQDLEDLRSVVAMQQGLGIDTHILDLPALRALEPRMATDDLVAACFEPEAGYADPVATSMAYAQRARQLGARVLQHTRVQALLLDGDRVRGVQLHDETEVEARTVIVAANIWAVSLLRAVGIDLPVHATRHACILLQQPPTFGPQHTILFDFTNGLYLRPEGVNLSMAGSLDESEAEEAVDPDHYNNLPTHGEEERLALRTANRFPALQDATLQSGWTGIYDVSADWQPIIGAAPGIDGLFCALGFSGHGFKLCPVVGELVANMVLDKETPDLDLDLFRVDRFAQGALTQGRYAYGIIG